MKNKILKNIFKQNFVIKCLKDKLYEQKSMLAAHYVTDAQLEYKYFINKETVV